MVLENGGNRSWVDRKINEEVLIMVDEKRELFNRITRTTKRWIGHIIRAIFTVNSKDYKISHVVEGCNIVALPAYSLIRPLPPFAVM